MLNNKSIDHMNPFVYGYETVNMWVGRKAQLKKQGFETEFYAEDGVGFVAGDPAPTPQEPTTGNYLTFTANQDNSRITFMSWCEEGITPPEFNFEYRMGTSGEWMTYELRDFTDPNVIDLEINQTVQFRGVNPNGLEDAEENYGVHCNIEGGICASGDLTSLINGVGGDIELPPYCFASLFVGASGLLTAPSLPSTTLSEGCYLGLFGDCTSLTTAPELPATMLAEECYDEMFIGCTSLTTAPELPATTLAEGCYNEMFVDCTSLNSITCLATDNSANNCTFGWVRNVAANGTFTKATEANWQIGNENAIPEGWVIYNNTFFEYDIDVFHDENIQVTVNTDKAESGDTITIETICGEGQYVVEVRLVYDPMNPTNFLRWDNNGNGTYTYTFSMPPVRVMIVGSRLAG